MIISMFFDASPLSTSRPMLGASEPESSLAAVDVRRKPTGPQHPGRVSLTQSGVKYLSEDEYYNMCVDRSRAGYNSGMGEIFRKVAAISPIRVKGEKRLSQ